MTRFALWSSAAGLAIAGFTAGTWLHPLALPDRSAPAAQHRSVDPALTAETLVKECGQLASPEKSACYQGELLPFTTAYGAKGALHILEGIVAADHDIAPISHSYAHAIGITAFDAHPDVKITFPSCSEIFQSGCYHGVIQAYFMRAGADDSGVVRGLCGPWTQDGVYGWLRFQCAHGLGHGLTMMLDHDLPEALQRCDYLADAWDRDSCYGGAFMENVMDATQPDDGMLMEHAHMTRAGHRRKFQQIDPKNPAYPCSILDDRYLNSCWVNQVSVILSITNGDIARAGAACQRAPAQYISMCFIGLGTDINGRAIGNADSALIFCGRTTPAWRAWCYVGVAKNRVEVGAQPSNGVAFCKVVSGRTEKMRCYEGLGEEIASVTEVIAERERYCAEGEAAYQEACRFGARLMIDRPRELPPEHQ